MNYNAATYMTGVAKFEELPIDKGIEIGFFGRSNTGKSSTINLLTSNKNLARTSRTPGRTQLIHLFQLDATRKLVDLPGYGYAKVTKAVKFQWQKTLMIYLTKRQCLKGVVLLIDSRHEVKKIDEIIIKLAIEYDLNLHILLIKADKLRRHQSIKCERHMKDYLAKKIKYVEKITFQVFSAVTGIGLDKFKHKLNGWYRI